MFKYPYGNTQELNLDWLLRSWQAYQTKLEDQIAPQYSNQVAYDDPAIVFFDHQLYYNTQAITVPEEFNPEHWQQTSIADIMLNWPF